MAAQDGAVVRARQQAAEAKEALREVKAEGRAKLHAQRDRIAGLGGAMGMGAVDELAGTFHVGNVDLEVYDLVAVSRLFGKPSSPFLRGAQEAAVVHGVYKVGRRVGVAVADRTGLRERIAKLRAVNE